MKMKQINLGTVMNELSKKYDITPIEALNTFTRAQDKKYNYNIRKNLDTSNYVSHRPTDFKAYELADRYLRMQNYLKNKNGGYTIEHLGFNK